MGYVQSVMENNHQLRFYPQLNYHSRVRKNNIMEENIERNHSNSMLGTRGACSKMWTANIVYQIV